jgi:DNA-binding beta-propeller fold protein YncE
MPTRTIRLLAMVGVVCAWVVGPLAQGRAETSRTGDAVRLWASTYNGTGNGYDVAQAVAASPDGSGVFVTGYSDGAANRDYATVAYDPTTGAERWSRRYDGPGKAGDVAVSMAVSPDGSRVFVTGQSAGKTSSDYATIAYDTATGERDWIRRYDHAASGEDGGADVAVNPDGSLVYVTGASQHRGTSSTDFATIAYDAVTGATEWVRRFDGPGRGTDYATALDVSADGTRLLVTGASIWGDADLDIATVSYDPYTGTTQWVTHYDDPDGANVEATDVRVSPDGSLVFVLGDGRGFATIAYSAAHGRQRWVAVYRTGDPDAIPAGLAVSPDGSRVFVTGSAYATADSSDSDDYVTLAYDAATGVRLWHRGYNGWTNERDTAYAIAASPDGSEVYVTGQALGRNTYSSTTIAYDAGGGGVHWVKHYHGHRFGARPTDLAVSPDGTHVFVTGYVTSPGSVDYGTVAYAIR